MCNIFNRCFRKYEKKIKIKIKILEKWTPFNELETRIKPKNDKANQNHDPSSIQTLIYYSVFNNILIRIRYQYDSHGAKWTVITRSTRHWLVVNHVKL